MSLVPTYVYCKNRMFYSELHYEGKFERPMLPPLPWFICFDDNDPPELVIMRDPHDTSDRHVRAKKILTDRGFNFHHLEFNGACQRQLQFKFKDAESFWFRLSGPAPEPDPKNGDSWDTGPHAVLPDGDKVVEGVQSQQLDKMIRKAHNEKENSMD